MGGIARERYRFVTAKMAPPVTAKPLEGLFCFWCYWVLLLFIEEPPPEGQEVGGACIEG